MALDTARQLDRRAFLAAAASTAAVGAVVQNHDAYAASDISLTELPQIIGGVAGHVSPRAMDIGTDDGDRRRVVLSPGARVERDGKAATLADFNVGNWILAVGTTPADGTFEAGRVIPAVLGARQPPRR